MSHSPSFLLAAVVIQHGKYNMAGLDNAGWFKTIKTVKHFFPLVQEFFMEVKKKGEDVRVNVCKAHINCHFKLLLYLIKIVFVPYLCFVVCDQLNIDFYIEYFFYPSKI